MGAKWDLLKATFSFDFCDEFGGTMNHHRFSVCALTVVREPWAGDWRRIFWLAVAVGLSTNSTIAADSAKIAEQYCFSCHGPEFEGGRAPALRGGNWRQAKNEEDAAHIVVTGLPALGMPAFGATLSAEDSAGLAHYIRTLSRPEKRRGFFGFFGGDNEDAVVRTELQNFRIEQVAEGLEVPWSLAFLTDGRILVTERAGRLRTVEKGRLGPPVSGLPPVWYRQDGGLLSLALDPDYEKNGWVYISYSEPGVEPGTSMTKVVRGHIIDGAWTGQEVVWQAEPRYYWRGEEHYGCRLLFVDGKLFFTIGDRGHRTTAQDLSNPCGKVHRVEADGKIPADNPFVGTPGADPSVWSYGHRNPQGLTLDESGQLWETEHGPMGGDELNHLQPGKNYGWPVVTFGRNQDGSIISELTTKPGMVDPITYWTPSIAVCPIHRAISDRYPRWKNQLLVGSLAREEFLRLEVRNDQLIHQERLFQGRGRIRDVSTGPDGYLYLAIDHGGRQGEIIRLVPLNE